MFGRCCGAAGQWCGNSLSFHWTQTIWSDFSWFAVVLGLIMEGLGNGWLGKRWTLTWPDLDVCGFARDSRWPCMWTMHLCRDGVKFQANGTNWNKFISNCCSMFEGNFAKKGRKGPNQVLFGRCGIVSCNQMHDSWPWKPKSLSLLASNSPIRMASQFSAWLETEHERQFPPT